MTPLASACAAAAARSIKKAQEASQHIKPPRDSRISFYDPCSCADSVAAVDGVNPRESGMSNTSRTVVRQRALALAVIHMMQPRHHPLPQCLQAVVPQPNYTIYNTESHGFMHQWLSARFGPAYVASEYVSPTAQPGTSHVTAVGDVRHEDLRRLSFSNGLFDLVLSAEVFEHIPTPYVALKEVFRVLKPGGTMLWTAPIILDDKATDATLSIEDSSGRRYDAAGPVKTSAGETIRSPQMHGDPMGGGIPVYQIFGAGQLTSKLCEIGFAPTHTQVVYSNRYGVVTPVVVMASTKPIAY